MSTKSTNAKGTERLLWDCATIGRSLETSRPSARSRLVAEIGEDLTGILLLTLREVEPSTAHEEALRRAVDDAA